MFCELNVIILFFIVLYIVLYLGVSNFLGLKFLFFFDLFEIINFFIVLVNVSCNLVFILIFVIFKLIVFKICLVGILLLLCKIILMFVVLVILFNVLKFNDFYDLGYLL